MRLISKILTYLFHPLLVPLYGTFLYFRITPKYSPLGMQSGNILPVFILTVIIPVISMLILRNLGMLPTALLSRPRDRIYPLLIFLVLLLMVLFRVIPNNYSSELYYFFLGMIVATTACLLLALAGKAVSLHLAGAGTLLMFLITLSIHFEKNIVIAISLCTLGTGLLGSARLYLKAHGRAAVLTGWLIGLVSQLILVQFWF
ncbi:hypothetical protein [Robiginitalea sp. SC105]|uniref:hypothetical protein n=1 Tax=Robiginitalea sp. SC105 TaxID=2762332 RepID=UPI001639BA8A|nr:hypothetical protein [Robiginitalea sp. SC105]MBC2838726.1 hypothetical protein [Robiginitalea sp. SC105]